MRGDAADYAPVTLDPKESWIVRSKKWLCAKCFDSGVYKEEDLIDAVIGEKYAVSLLIMTYLYDPHEEA